MSESLGHLPTVRPADIRWLAAARRLLEVPIHSVIILGDEPALAEHWAAFFSAAVVSGAHWGVRHGAVRVTTVYAATPAGHHDVDVVAAFDRLAIVVSERGPLVPAELERRLASVSTAPQYPMAWAAAAYVQTILDGP